MKYLRGICYICGKGIYLNEPYKTDPNLVCEIIVCSECHKKTIGLSYKIPIFFQFYKLILLTRDRASCSKHKPS